MNRFATLSIREICKSGISSKNLTDYALLDRVTNMDEKNKQIFYAKVIQLIE